MEPRYYTTEGLDPAFVYLYTDWSNQVYKVKLVRYGAYYYIERLETDSVQSIKATTTKLVKTNEKI